MSKAIYQPKGKAKEYAEWACNLYTGCENNCAYCYCKRGVLSSAMGGPRALLKTCFSDPSDAFHTFLEELQRKVDSIRVQGGLFFSFSSDPCLPETIDLTMSCIGCATGMEVPCVILTKCADWVLDTTMTDWVETLSISRKLLRIGFTLTGHDELEPGASPNLKRISAMRKLHDAGFRTFASIEPVIDFESSLDMIRLTAGICDEYKIGLISGKKDAYAAYDMPARLSRFVTEVNGLVGGVPVLWKKSVLDKIRN